MAVHIVMLHVEYEYTSVVQVFSNEQEANVFAELKNGSLTDLQKEDHEYLVQQHIVR